MITFSEITSSVLSLAANVNLFGFVIAACIILAFKLMPTVSPRVRYVVATVAFLAALIIPAAVTFENRREKNFPGSSITETGSGGETAAIQRIENSREAVLTPTTSVADAETISHDNLTKQNSSEVRNISFPGNIFNKEQKRGVFELEGSWWATRLIAVWFIVAFLLVGKELLAHIFLMKLRRSLRPADLQLRQNLKFPDSVMLYVNDRIAPCSLGLIRPVVVIPQRLIEELPLEAGQAIVRHELAHARWRDPAVNALLRIIRAIFWVSFPLWILEKIVRTEREAAADRAALASAEKTAATQYADSLILVAERLAQVTKRSGGRFLMTGIVGRTNLEKRVRRLFVFSNRLSPIRLIFATLVAFAGIWAIIILPVAQPVSMAKSFAENTLEKSLSISQSQELNKNFGNQSTDNDRTFQVEPRTSFASTETEISPNGSMNLQIRETTKEQIIPVGLNDGYEAGNGSPISDSFPQSNEINRNDLSDAQGGDEWAALGYKNLSADTLAAIQKVALKPEFIREMAVLGYTNLSIDTLIDMKRLGVSASFIREMAAEGYDKLSAELLIDYRRQAVSPAYVREMRSQGYSNLSPQMLGDFKRQAVSTGYIEEMAALGYGNLPARTILEFRQQAVSSTFIKELRETVNGNISANELVDMRKQAVSRKFIDEVNAAVSYERPTARQILNLRQNGVTADFIAKMNARDSKNYSINELIFMRMKGER